jgi:L-glyceraldehyde 3-phosphate reductase
MGTGCIAFSPLAQGMLTTKYLGGVPEGARASRGGSLSRDLLTDQNLAAIRRLNDIATQRGQTLAQMAIAWVLRDPRVTSALIGARTVEQLDDSLDAIKQLAFSAEELAAIDGAAEDGGLNLWSEICRKHARGSTPTHRGCLTAPFRFRSKLDRAVLPRLMPADARADTKRLLCDSR